MYSIKIYDRNWVFKATLSEKLVNCGYSFSATVNGGFSGLSFEYFGKIEIKHRDRVKIYKGTQAIYQGFVIGIAKLSDRSWEKQVINCSGMLGLLAFMPYQNKTQTANPSKLIRDLFSDLAGFATSEIQEYHGEITLKSENLTFLTFLQEVLKHTRDWGFFIDAENVVHFKPYTTRHLLTHGEDCYSIDIAEESSNYFNHIVLEYEGGNLEKKDEIWIQNYGLSKIIVQESEIKDQATAQLRINSLLVEKSIMKNCKIAVNSNYKFERIKPWDIVSIRNTQRAIQNKPVKQVQYWPNTATVILDSYQSLEHFISQK